MYTTFLDKEVNTMVSKDIEIMNTVDSSTHREKTDADISRHFKWIFVDAEYFDPSFILTFVSSHSLFRDCCTWILKIW